MESVTKTKSRKNTLEKAYDAAASMIDKPFYTHDTKYKKLHPEKGKSTEAYKKQQAKKEQDRINQEQKEEKEKRQKREKEKRKKEERKKARQEWIKNNDIKRNTEKEKRRQQDDAYAKRSAEYNATIKEKRTQGINAYSDAGKIAGQNYNKLYLDTYNAYYNDYDKRLKELEENNKKQQEEYQRAREKAYEEGTDPNAIPRPRKRYVPVTSQQALADLHGSTKSLINSFFNDINNSSEQAWNDVQKDREGFMKGYSESGAKSLIGDIIGTSSDMVYGIGKNIGLNEKQLEKLDVDSLLALQKAKFSKKMTEMTILQQIASKVGTMSTADWVALKKDGVSVYLMEKAYISAYISQTFGNKEFMSKTIDFVGKKFSVYVEALTEEKIDAFDDSLQHKIDNGFSKINSSIDTSTKKINTKLDKITKLDIVTALNDKLSIEGSIDKFTDRLTSSPIGKVFAPAIKSIGKAVGSTFKAFVTSSPVVSALKGIQNRVIKFQKNLNKAKEALKKRVEEIKNYVTDLKNKAIAKVKEYAMKIVADITSKITSALKGAVMKSIKFK